MTLQQILYELDNLTGYMFDVNADYTDEQHLTLREVRGFLAEEETYTIRVALVAAVEHVISVSDFALTPLQPAIYNAFAEIVANP